MKKQSLKPNEKQKKILVSSQQNKGYFEHCFHSSFDSSEMSKRLKKEVWGEDEGK